MQAVSRGAGLCHFVELDPFVIGKVLQPNIDACASGGACVVHNGRAEEFLQRAERAPSFAGGPFDFISACPPYEKVSYPEVTRETHGWGLYPATQVLPCMRDGDSGSLVA